MPSWTDTEKLTPKQAERLAKALGKQNKGNDSAQTLGKPQKRNKYNAVKTEYKGVIYDSKGEANYAAELDMKQRAGLIQGWARQVEFVLTGGVKTKVDFIIFYTDGTYDVVDFKGVLTQESKNKYKQVKAVHGIEVEIAK